MSQTGDTKPAQANVTEKSSSTSYVKNEPKGLPVPPEDVRTRIIGLGGRRYFMFDPKRWTNPYWIELTDKSDGGFWNIQTHRAPQNFSNAGGRQLFMLKSNMGNYYVMSGDSGGRDDIKVGHYDPTDNRQAWTFVKGDGRLNKWFRMVNLANAGLYLRTNQRPYVNCWPKDLFSMPDQEEMQYFQFEPEDMRVERIDYDLSKGVLGVGSLESLMNQTVTNNSDRDQTTNAAVMVSTQESSSWDADVGVSITAGVEVSGGIGVVEGRISSSVTLSASYKWGGVNTTTKQLEISVPVTMSPGKKYRVTATVLKGTIDVPFTAYLISDATDLTASTQGRYRGVTAYEFAAEYRLLT